MFCKSCGSKLPENTAACPQCGAATPYAAGPGAAPPPFVAPPPYEGVGTTPAYGVAPAYGAPPPQQPYGGMPPYGAPAAPPQKKRNKTVAIVLGLVAVLLVAALLLYFFVFSGAFGNDKQTVRNALQATRQTLAGQLEAAGEQLGTGIMGTAYEDAVSMEYGLEMDIENVRVNLDGSLRTDLANRKAAMDMSLGLAGTHLLQLGVGLEDNLMAVTAPELFKGSYGFYTDTLGADFVNSELAEVLGMFYYYGYDTGLEETAFNLFDLLEEGRQQADAGTDSYTMEDLEAAFDRLWEAAAVAKNGKEDIRANGHTQTAQAYTVTLPRAALLDYLAELVDILEEDQRQGGSLGLLVERLTGSAYEGYSLEMLTYYLEEIEQSLAGDATVVLHLAKGHVVKAQARLPANMDYTLTLELGGAENLSDALALRLQGDGELLLEMTAEGFHTPRDGLFTTDLALRVYDGYEDALVTVFRLEIYYDTAESLDNFELRLRTENAGSTVDVRVAGTYEVDPAAKRIVADWYDVTATTGDGDTVKMALSYTYTVEDRLSFEPLKPKMLFDLSSAELYSLSGEIEDAFDDIADILYDLDIF